MVFWWSYAYLLSTFSFGMSFVLILILNVKKDDFFKQHVQNHI